MGSRDKNISYVGCSIFLFHISAFLSNLFSTIYRLMAILHGTRELCVNLDSIENYILQTVLGPTSDKQNDTIE